MTYHIFFFSSRRRHTRLQGDWSSDVCSSDLVSDLDDLEAMVSPRPDLGSAGVYHWCPGSRHRIVGTHAYVAVLLSVGYASSRCLFGSSLVVGRLPLGPRDDDAVSATWLK